MPDESSSPMFVDVAFPARGDTIPLDHGYLLFGALSRLLPELHAEAEWGIHRVYGERLGPGVLRLLEQSNVRLRVPGSRIGDLLPLAGAALDVGGHRILLSAPRVFPLVPAATLRSRLVVVKKFHEDPDAFVDAFRRQLAAYPDLGQPAGSVEVDVGERRVLRVADHTIVGFPVLLSGLQADASLAVQRRGLGGRRHMGAGIFVVPRRGRA